MAARRRGLMVGKLRSPEGRLQGTFPGYFGIFPAIGYLYIVVKKCNKQIVKTCKQSAIAEG
jgi:hypothetical protein